MVIIVNTGRTLYQQTINMKTKKIIVEVSLNEENVPEKMTWEAEDNPGQGGEKECKAILMSLFDKEHKDTLKIDLWTTEMQVGEMDRLFFHTLRSLSETYYKATQNQKLANQMRQFSEFFGEETGIIPKEQE